MLGLQTNHELQQLGHVVDYGSQTIRNFELFRARIGSVAHVLSKIDKMKKSIFRDQFVESILRLVFFCAFCLFLHGTYHLMLLLFVVFRSLCL